MKFRLFSPVLSFVFSLPPPPSPPPLRVAIVSSVFIFRSGKEVLAIFNKMKLKSIASPRVNFLRSGGYGKHIHTRTHFSLPLSLSISPFLSRLPINSIPFKQGTRRCIALPPAVHCGLSLIIHALCFTGSTVDVSLSVPQVERVALHKATDGRGRLSKIERAGRACETRYTDSYT